MRGFARARAAVGLSSLVILLLLPTLNAFGGPANIRDGIAVVAPGNMRYAYLNPGDPITIWVKGDRLIGPTNSPSHDGIRAIQFAVDVDPRLFVVQTALADPNAFDLEVGPNEWVLGMDCLGLYDGYPEIMAYTLLLSPNATDIDNIRVSLKDLETFGEGLAWTTCAGGEFRRDIFNAGGILINPTPGSIVHLSAAPRVVMEGQPYRVAWETVGADEVLLNGVPVAAADGLDEIATVDQDYVLTTITGGVEKTEQLRVEIIREPRVVSFTAQRYLSNSQYRVHLSWVTLGSRLVTFDGDARNFPAIGDANFLDKVPSEWVLRAVNDQGVAVALASPDPIPNGPPRILDFSSVAENWSPASPLLVNWSLFGADDARIEPGIGPVDPASHGAQISLNASTQLELIATNQYGESRATLDFTLQSPVVKSFDLSGWAYGGHPVDLVWDTSYADEVSISPYPGSVAAPDGQVQIVAPASQTVFVLTAINASGSVQQNLTVTPARPSLQVRPPTTPIVAGVPFQFEIQVVTGATTLSVSPDIGSLTPVAQFVDVVIAEDTVFTVTATNDAGSSVSTVTANIAGYGEEPPVVSLTADNATAPLGTPVELSYVIQNAQSASLEPGLGSITAVPGTITVTPSAETTYVLSATNPNGTSTAEVTVTPGGPAIKSFTVDDDPLPFGQPSTHLRWEFVGATASGIAALGLSDLDPTGSVEIFPTADTNYELVISNPFGQATAMVSVTLGGPPAQIDAFAAAPSVIRTGDTAYLSWSVSGVYDDVEIVGLGSQAAQGQLAVQPTLSTIYTLRVTTSGSSFEQDVTVTVDDSLAPDLVLAWSGTDENAAAPVILPFQPFNVWGLALGMDAGLSGASYRLELPPCVSLMSQSYPSGGLNVGNAPDAVLGLGQCVSGPLLALTEYSLMVNVAEGCPSGTELSLAAPSVGGGLAEWASCANTAVPFRLGAPIALYAGSGGQAQALQVELDAKPMTEGVELSWSLPGEMLPSTLCLHRLSSAGDERLEEWANKDLAKDGKYIDASAPEGEPIEYWLEAEYGGTTVSSDRVQLQLAISYIPPREPLFHGASPNPFNPRTEIRFELDRARQVTLRIYDLSGRRIWSHSQRFDVGPQSVVWTGVDHAGRSVASGSYFVQLEYEGGSKNSRLTLVR